MSSLSTSKSLTIYPYEPWDKKLLLCIDNAIKSAWKSLLNIDDCKLEEYEEERITEALERELQRIMDSEQESGFNRMKLQNISRGSKFRSFDDEHLEFQPDLIVRQLDLRHGIGDSRYDALFIECKIIEKGKAPLLYIEKGIRRFVEGEYAWAMPHAMMVAYVKDGKRLPLAIKKSFKDNSKKSVIIKCAPRDSKWVELSETKNPKTYQSLHVRPWIHAKYGTPGDIAIFHIWLVCNCSLPE